MFTTQMTQLFAVILKKDKERVTEALLREGVMQFISISEIETAGADRLSPLQPEAALTDVSDLRKRIQGILHTIGIIPSIPQETDLNQRMTVNIPQETRRLDALDGERRSLRERQRQIQKEILKLEDMKRQVDLYGIDLSHIQRPARQSLLAIKTGKLPLSQVPHLENGLKDLPALHMTLGQQHDTVHHMLLYMKRDEEQINHILSHTGWASIELPQELVSTKKDFNQDITVKLKALTDQQNKIHDQIDNLVKKESSHLKSLWVSLRVNELCAKIQTHFQSSSRAVVFAGWQALSKKHRINHIITQACAGHCYLQWHGADSKEVTSADIPVELKNPPLLAPFQMLVSNFGMPQYGTIDPTPFVMPIYLIMFGLMFADAGQGLVLALLGALGVFHFKKKHGTEGWCNLCLLIIWCGCSSILFGVLFGSYFGTSLFPALWFDYHGIVFGHRASNSMINDVYDILQITIYFGIGVIVMGLLFNWINLLRTKQWAAFIFDKGGILGAWIYCGGIYTAYFMVTHDYQAFPAGSILFLLIGLPSLLLLLKEPYHHFIHPKTVAKQKSNPILIILRWIMEWIVELLEIFSGYLSNTLSFMRVAGLGIAHVCLMLSFFTLAQMTSGIFAVLILILGNILVIGLEGLSAGIQALRLNYYEFFTKFFHGTGQMYTPISLKSEL